MIINFLIIIQEIIYKDLSCDYGKWEYYVNQVYEMDQFVGDLIKAVEARKEPSVVVFYGDHLPTMGLKAEDLKSRYLYNTNYVIWDNVGLQKQDKNIPAYQLMSEILNRLEEKGTISCRVKRKIL